MRCKDCGTEVKSSEVFCPKCGAPLRLTADYDLIQAEIGGKVDKFMNDDEQPVRKRRNTGSSPKKAYDGKTIIIPSDGTKKPPTEITIIGEKPRDEHSVYDTLSVTKAIYGKDSIFAADGKLDTVDDFSYEDSEADTSSINYEDYDEEDFVDKGAAVPKKSNGNSRPRRTNTNKPDNKDLYRIKARAKERQKKKKRLIIIVAILAVLVIGTVVGIIIGSSKKKNEEEEVMADQISCSVVDGGEYSAPLEIKLSSQNDYLIRYTFDGSEPSTKSEKYGQPIILTNEDASQEGISYTLKVSTYNNSIKKASFSVTFTLYSTTLEAPYMDLDSGDYYEVEYISIYGPEGVDIYYDYNGSTPSVLSTLYTEPIEMRRGNHILNAIAIDKNGTKSDVTSCVYNLEIESNYSYEEALALVMSELLSSGLIESDEPNDNNQYPVPEGGTRRVINGGITIIDNEQYYIIQVDFTNDGSTVQATTYYGVNDQDGSVNKLNKSGMEFTIA